jgi:hypothetical protein
MDNTHQVIHESKNGDKTWWLDLRRHREDGPAIERANGVKEWCLNGEHHRTDGPAIEWSDGSTSWRLNSEWLPFDEWLRRNNELTEGEKVMFKLHYG